MDELARDMAMSKKTLYASFPSKTALLEAVILEKFRRIDADLGRAGHSVGEQHGQGAHRDRPGDEPGHAPPLEAERREGEEGVFHAP